MSMSKLFIASVLALAVSASGVAAGLEQLESRYGQAYPGYAGLGYMGNNGVNGGGMTGLGLQATPYGQQQQASFGMGVGVQQPILNQQQPIMQQMMNQQQQFGQQQFTGINNQQQLGLSQQPTWQQQQQFGGYGQEEEIEQQQPMFGAAINHVMPAYGAAYGVPSLGSAGVELNQQWGQQGQQQQFGQQQFGGVGSYGVGAGLGASKKTTTAAPIYAASMIVPKIITQPILRPHMVTQPILQQQLIQQPIVETRQVIQPVIRRIITQPIIRPQIYESTTVQPTLKTLTTVQPHIVQQTVVTPQLQNVYEENAPITEAATTQTAKTVVQPTINAKKSSGGLGLGYGGF